MKTALALRHVAFEDLGLIEPLLRARGYAVRYHDVGDAPLAPTSAAAQPDLLVVLGGPIGAFDEAAYHVVGERLALVRQRLARRLPTLGICLGAQLMARALGAPVAPMGHKEIGLAPLRLTAEGERSALAPLAGVPVLHWHGDQFGIPPGAQHLAATDLCPHQAFAVGRHALALQFHLEADLRRIEPWLVGHACELAAAGVDPAALRAAASAQAGPLARAAEAVLGRWLGECEEAA